mmetsp:Transcript_57683/g.153719  ORF Transcript_57683/g.153719 Transcript_57683/m.153719 type:complete len:284 (-) Transcript_57683:2677-3528(-)
MALLLFDENRLREEQHEGREHEARVHDVVIPAHNHGVTVNHPFVAVPALHPVFLIHAASKWVDLCVVISPPVWGTCPFVQRTEVWSKACSERTAQQRVFHRAPLDWFRLFLLHVITIVTRFNHKADKLLSHHVGHVHGFGAEAMLVTEKLIRSILDGSSPLAVGLKVGKVIRIVATLEVFLADVLWSIFLVRCSSRSLLERTLYTQECGDHRCWPDTPEGTCYQQHLRHLRRHRNGGTRAAQSCKFSFICEAVNVFQRTHCVCDCRGLRSGHGCHEHFGNVLV